MLYISTFGFQKLSHVYFFGKKFKSFIKYTFLAMEGFKGIYLSSFLGVSREPLSTFFFLKRCVEMDVALDVQMGV